LGSFRGPFSGYFGVFWDILGYFGEGWLPWLPFVVVVVVVVLLVLILVHATKVIVIVQVNGLILLVHNMNRLRTNKVQIRIRTWTTCTLLYTFRVTIVIAVTICYITWNIFVSQTRFPHQCDI
jgi:hypothetical protein